MRWRCGVQGAHLRCQLSPFHQGMHAATILLDGEIAIVNWGMADEEPPPDVVEIEPAAVATLEQVVIDAIPSYPTRAKKARDWEGRRRERQWLDNLYAAAEEGIHTNWDLYGHEILRLPTLDELEMEMR